MEPATALCGTFEEVFQPVTAVIGGYRVESNAVVG
jgi:hypothetical protein